MLRLRKFINHATSDNKKLQIENKELKKNMPTPLVESVDVLQQQLQRREYHIDKLEEKNRHLEQKIDWMETLLLTETKNNLDLIIDGVERVDLKLISEAAICLLSNHELQVRKIDSGRAIATGPTSWFSSSLHKVSKLPMPFPLRF
ncbi:hypothetical protein N7539_008593 [Penicillium diatomitis]|uniref:Uncharacterized protein n=1 Tax=Penicillium diatomitis TaxID=2819901 RepID=A0A9W9WQZ4_9EURO|nr:uncharacterized protein N7539_008593 [Penicillium diatomitis]KAJ5472024.1 hypothetical protein N7539_008593 [Penicillium diatomitis]